MPSDRLYAIGPFLFDVAERRLTRDGTEIALTPKTFEILLILVERPGHLLQKSELMQALWPDTFVEEVTLARHISTLRKALGDGVGEMTFIETVPKSGYRLVAPVRVLTNSGSNTPAGPIAAPPSHLPATETTDETRLPAGEGGIFAGLRPKTLGIAFAGAAFVTLIVGWSWTGSTAGRKSSPPVRSLAVLPFKPLGQSEPLLELGLADTLIARLNHLPLIVRPISAVRDFTDPHTDPLAAGRALKVDAVLDGTVQQIRDAVRITATIQRVSDGVVLWSGSFEERAESIFRVEDSIAVQVATAIVPQLTREATQRMTFRETSNPEAAREYLLGRYFWNRHDFDGLRKAVDHFERAVALDPQYALAYVGLADAYLLLPDHEVPRENVSRGRAAATRALDLDPTLAEAHTSLALIAMNYDWDWAEAGRRYRRAIELNPNYAVAHAWYGEYLAFMGRFEEGYAKNLHAQHLDPVAIFIRNDAAKILWLWRKYDRALAAAQQALELDPTSTRARLELAGAYEGLGRYADAIDVFRYPGFSLDDPTVMQSRVGAYAQAGRMAEAEAAFAKLIEMSRSSFVPAQTLARAAILIGDRERAFLWLNQMCDERAPGPIALKVDPAFDSIRDDPRFDQLLRRVGLLQ